MQWIINLNHLYKDSIFHYISSWTRTQRQSPVSVFAPSGSSNLGAALDRGSWLDSMVNTWLRWSYLHGWVGISTNQVYIWEFQWPQWPQSYSFFSMQRIYGKLQAKHIKTSCKNRVGTPQCAKKMQVFWYLNSRLIKFAVMSPLLEQEMSGWKLKLGGR